MQKTWCLVYNTTRGYTGLHKAIHRHMWEHTGIQGYIRQHKGMQGYTPQEKDMQGYTRQQKCVCVCAYLKVSDVPDLMSVIAGTTESLDL